MRLAAREGGTQQQEWADGVLKVDRWIEEEEKKAEDTTTRVAATGDDTLTAPADCHANATAAATSAYAGATAAAALASWFAGAATQRGALHSLLTSLFQSLPHEIIPPAISS